MFHLFKKKTKVPVFDYIKSHPDKEKYFVRIKKWSWINSEQITILKKESEGKIKMLTLDYWHQEMFLDADGQKTILEYLDILVKQFKKSKMEIPSDLDKFMIETLFSLKTDLNAIEFKNEKTEIDGIFKEPIKK